MRGSRRISVLATLTLRDSVPRLGLLPRCGLKIGSQNPKSDIAAPGIGQNGPARADVTARQNADLRFWVELRGFEPLTPSMRTLATMVGSGRCRWPGGEARRIRTMTGVLVAARVAAHDSCSARSRR